MMTGNLPQTPAQSGIASILAALGAAPAATGGGEAGPAADGFAQLLSTLPASDGAVPLPRGAAAEAVIEVPATPVEMAAGADLPAAADPAGDDTAPMTDLPTEPAPARAPDAAAVASLLIRATTGTLDAPGDAAKTAPAANADKVPDEAGDREAPVADPDVAPDPAVIVALPVAAPAVAARPARSIEPARGDAAAAPQAAPAKGEAATPAPIFGAEAKAAKPSEGGASMAVIFAPPAAQTAPVASAATAGPVAARVLDTSSDDAWIAQLAADIAATQSSEGELSFRLMPRHLGRLDVAMTRGDEGVSVRLDTQHEATATVVHAAQGKLVEDLRQQGVRVAGAEVTCTPNETGRQQQGQGRAPAPGAAHLIETATEGAPPRADTSSDAGAEGRRSRFA